MKTKNQKLAEAHTLYTTAKSGTIPHRGAKDGSIPVHAIIDVPKATEKKVLADCLKWFRARRIVANRHDCGSGPGPAIYGIRSAGDIIGLTKLGRHFEIETKRSSGGRLSKGQQERMEIIQASGGIYLVICGIEELECYNNEHSYFD